MRTARLVLVLVLATGLLTGCWSRREITEIAVVLGTGVDRTAEGKIRLTVQIARPTAFAGATGAGGGGGGGQATPTSWVVWADGRTVEEAERSLARLVPRQLYWGHCIVLVFGEEMARHGLYPVIDFFLRSRQPREIMWVMMAKGEAREVMESYSPLANTSAQAAGFLALLKVGKFVRLKDLAEMLASREGEPVATRVEVREAGTTPGPAPGQGTSPTVPRQVEITGSAVFRRDRLIGWFNAYETTGLKWLKGEVDREVLLVPTPSREEEKVSVSIMGGRTRILPELSGDRVRFHVQMRVDAMVAEQQSLSDLARPPQAKALEALVAEEIRRRALVALRKAQQDYGVDPFRFGRAFHQKYPRQWREIEGRWNELFRRAEFRLEVKVHLRELGLEMRRVDVPPPKS